MNDVRLAPGDALLIADVQNDFITGTLAVPGGGEIVPVLNRYLALFAAHSLPVFATRDWHPPDHCSFRSRGGTWPLHCVAGTPGAAFVAGFALPADAVIVSKATTVDREAYSAFSGTELEALLRSRGIVRLFVGGLATDYCVLETARDGRRLGYPVFVLTDAIRAVDVTPGDGARAIAAMVAAGATPIVFEDIVEDSADRSTRP
jgi:nicotinamidase/pyrazinamidase